MEVTEPLRAHSQIKQRKAARTSSSEPMQRDTAAVMASSGDAAMWARAPPLLALLNSTCGRVRHGCGAQTCSSAPTVVPPAVFTIGTSGKGT